jgi:hypothetical protein
VETIRDIDDYKYSMAILLGSEAGLTTDQISKVMRISGVLY